MQFTGLKLASSMRISNSVSKKTLQLVCNDFYFIQFQEDFLSYLPRSDCNPVNFGSFEIHCVSETDEGHYRMKELDLVGRVEWVC